MNRYTQQEGYGLGGVFRKMGRFFGPKLKPVLKGIADIGVTVGGDLLQNLLNDVISGKSSKASAKSRGRQAGVRAVDLARQRALVKLLQQNQTGGTSTKRKRSQSSKRSRTPARKRKRSQSGKRSQTPAKKWKRSQTGGSVRKSRRPTKQQAGKTRKRKPTKRKRPQIGKGKPIKQQRTKNRKKPFAVIKARGMTAKQRKALPKAPQKDIFG